MSKRFDSKQLEIYNHHKFGIKLSEYSTKEEAKMAIGNVLLLVFELVGIMAANRPSLQAKKELADFVYNTYRGICPEEIKLAFNLFFEGKLKLIGKKREEYEHYQSFSIPYLTKIMNAYLEYKSTSISELDNHFEQKQQIKEFSDRLSLNDRTMKALIIKTYNELSNLENPSYIFLFSNAYDFIDSIGMVNLSIKEKNTILENTKAELKAQELEAVSKVRRASEKIRVMDSFKKVDLIKQAKSNSFILVLNNFISEGKLVDQLEKELNQHCYICKKSVFNMIELTKQMKHGKAKK